MVDVLQQNEALPANYPEVPTSLSANAAALDTDALWARIEEYTAHRFTDREVIWVFEGQEGELWKPNLTPLTSQTAEKWESEAWVSVNLQSSPIGFCLPSDGVFRITGQVGAGPVPASVSEAFRRLAEYSVEISSDGMVSGHAAHATHDVDIGGVKETFSRSQAWAARALQLSGAADLLRSYRRV